MYGYPTPRPGKHWSKSRTLWFNVISTLLITVEMQMPMLQPLLGYNVYIWLVLGVSMINAVLRTVTTEPLMRHD